MIKKIKWKPVNIFFLISFIGIFSYFIYAYFNGHTAMLWLAQENNTKIRFLDYFMHIETAAKNGNIYDGLADIVGCFPPLAYIMYRFLFRITAYPEMECRGWKEFAGVEGAEIVFLYYSMFVAALFLIAIIITGRNDMKKSVALFFCLMLSVSFFGSGYAMGNSTMLVLAMLVFALHLKDTDSRVGKETGLILIALSAGLKIYPAIFGLLYLKEKRYKEAARLVVYGLLCGFLPFVFFGGLDAVVSWIEHIKGTMGLLELGRIQCIKGAVYFLLVKITGLESHAAITFLSNAAPWIFIILMITLAWFSKNRYRTIFFLAAGMIFFPTNAYRYSLSYLVLPLILYIKETDGQESMQRRCIVSGTMILYGLLFTIPTWWGVLTSFELTFPYFTLTYVELYIYAIAYLLMLYLTVDEGILLIRKERKNA